MISPNFDMVIVGGGCAGMTAAIGLVKSGFTVAVVEAASFPGAENWSGCVYFCENLAHPDILGPDGVESLAWERRLIERGFFATDGHGLLGMTYRDPSAFRHCYTVLRPIFDQHIAQIAAQLGVAVLNETTAESLIRDGERVIGVSTQRGAIYADLVFLAEGDASHLVTREGYERFADKRDSPKFLQGIKQVIDLPPGAIEEIFKVGPEEGVAYEMLVRNGSLRGKHVHLNMGGFVYANRQSLSVGLVLPADNLAQHFDGDPNLLIEWFEQLPALKPWLEKGKRGVFGAKIIRGGGARDIPRLIDDGLAIGGAASAIGIDFPYPNFTGPATRMGLLLVQAARRIREEKGKFTAENLDRHYLQPLQRTHYWQDVEFLRRWPGYVKRTTVFFDSQIDLALGSAYVWTRPRRWLLSRWLNWARLAWDVAGPASWQSLRADAWHLRRALRLREVVGRPGVWRMLLDGSLNALRDVFGSPRRHLSEAGTVELHYSVGGGSEPSAVPHWILRRWSRRFFPVLASAARHVYANDEEPIREKLSTAIQLLFRQVNILDLIGAGLIGLAAVGSSAALAGLSRLWSKLTGRPRGGRQGSYAQYSRTVRQVADLTPLTPTAAQHWESRLGQLLYRSVKDSHIHVLWPQSLPDRNKVARQGLWHVCPARVYEARVGAGGQVQVVVNFENCIKCETCWRTSDLVDWGRDGQHRFVYPVHSPSANRLLATAETAGASRPAIAGADAWEATVRELSAKLRADELVRTNGHYAAETAELHVLLGQLDRKLSEFAEALAEEPRTIDKPRAAYLEMLARYAHQLAVRIVEILSAASLADNVREGIAAIQKPMRSLAIAMTARADERTRRVGEQRYSWAAAEGRQIQQHHLVGLRRLLALLGDLPPSPTPSPASRWLRAETDAAEIALPLAPWKARLDAALGRTAWRDLDRGTPLTSEQDALLRELLAQVPALDPNELATTLHPPIRKALLAELGRRDPSLAYRAACHLWARDLARLAGAGSASLARAAGRWATGDEWACFVGMDAVQTSGSGWHGEALLVPAMGAQSILLLIGGHLAIVPVSPSRPELTIEPLAALGLRGAGMARIRLANFTLPELSAPVDRARLNRAWSILSAADLTSIASGMAGELCGRALAHANSRVQFPGLFHDEDARDTIGKFGAIKKMLADMGARRFLLETLDHALSPVDLSGPSAEHAGMVKAVVAEALGCSPGSLSYNAGQIMGGTGFSEDDIFAKFYRDAAAWRFLGPGNIEVCRHHGEELLHGWRPDGQRLTNLPGEAELFDQLARRKALQAELDEVRVFRSHLRSLVNEWLAAGGSPLSVTPPKTDGQASPPLTFTPRARALVSEALGRQDAYLLASKAVLLRLHSRMERGLPSETEAVLVRVWLRGAAALLDEFDSQMRVQLTLAGEPNSQPARVPGAALPTTYEAFLSATNPYDSGDFLEQPINPLRPRYVPEMVESDPALAARNAELRDKIAGYFGQLRDGLPYERFVERNHRPTDADLDFCRQNGFFRFPIPRELGGEARPKVDYYLLTTACQRLADVAVSLTIQVNSSLGTSPVLLSHAKDLPRAEKELAAFAADAALHKDISSRLESLSRLLVKGDPSIIESTYLQTNEPLQKVFASAAIRALAHRFAEAWQQAGLAGRAFDLAGMRQPIEQAKQEWNAIVAGGRAQESAAEMGRRREASDLFLRWVASGQISAFALTEPSAGSDTARVATRAVLRSVPVEREQDGVLRFVPFGVKEPRYLLDAKHVEFQPHGTPPVGLAVYRYSGSAEPAPIHFDEYDYETDDPRRMRYYDHGSRRVHFTDIAQLRERDGRLFYDYWELTGAKMWITNGRMSGIMCLYAKTEEGITGFIVDRHAEGLIVGKDEDKLGQCGSPTNELSLQSVRVPRENVIGIEGRGQVNALETLNIGRAGLAMSAMAQMTGLIEQSRAFAQSAYGEIPDWVEWRLDRMEEERFFSEAVAHEVIGQFEHKQTKSVRLESAIAKALVSESLHRVIELAEDIHGLAGQTQLHLVEKRRRDARVLNIYEGTNEIQRFFVLKDLAGAKPKPADSPKSANGSDVESVRLGVRQRVGAALEVFGQDLWQNPNLQANCFLISEAVMWLKAADSALGRLAWINTAGNRQWAKDTGQQAMLRCGFEVRNRLRRFDDALGQLRRGSYADEVRAARLMLARSDKVSRPVPLSRITKPLSVLVVLEPTAATGPQPHLENGRLAESHWTLNPPDRAALETAFRLREQAPSAVKVHVAAVGPRAAGVFLREALSLGADRATLLLAESGPIAPDAGAAALAAVLRSAGPFDLVLGGDGKPSHEEGLFARLTAEGLGISLAGSATALAVRATEKENELLLQSAQDERSRPLPAMVAIEPEWSLRAFTIEGYLSGLTRTVNVERLPATVNAAMELLPAMTQAEAATDEPKGAALNPAEAASQVLHVIGAHGPAAVVSPFAGEIEAIDEPRWAGKVLAILAADTSGRLEGGATAVVRAAELLAESGRYGIAVLLLTSLDEESQRRAVAELRAMFPGEIVILVADRTAPAEMRSRLLAECWPRGEQPRFVVGESWTEAALGHLAFSSAREQSDGEWLAFRVHRLAVQGNQVVVETLRGEGKLVARRKLPLDSGKTCWLTLAGDASIAEGSRKAASAARVYRWSPLLERFYGREDIHRLLDEVKSELGVLRLADAEFILDVGFGVGNRDGYEAVIDPLEKALRQLGVQALMIGGSRKVTEELHLLPADRQIGQSGVSVNPRVLLAIGVSGAPQHLNYIGPRATIVAFNRDPESPLMTLNRRQAQPRVFGVVGDLFETVPAFIAALGTVGAPAR